MSNPLDLLPPGVAEAFGLANTQAPVVAPQAPVPTPQAPATTPKAPRPPRAKKPRKKAQRSAQRRPARSEEVDVVARQVGAHKDLRDLVGYLTVDYDSAERPYEVTFDPFDERIRSVIIPIHGWLRSESRIHVTDDDTVRWRFDILADPPEYEEEEEEEEDEDG